MTLAESETALAGRANGAARPTLPPPQPAPTTPGADAANARVRDGTGQRRLMPTDTAAVKAEARRLIEGTTLSAYAIARKLDIADSTVSNWKKAEGWTRPDGAPVQPAFGGRAPQRREPRDRHADMVTRLYRVFDRQTADLEARAAGAGATTDEKDARTLSVLARTLDILKALDRDDGAKTDAPEPADRERFNAELARRIKRWAEGGEEA